MARTTQRKGDVAQARAIMIFTTMGFDVSVPITESAEYDLIVDNGEGLHRVQCKYSTPKWVDLRKIHSNSQGYVIKRYSAQSYDWLFAHRPGFGDYLVKGIDNIEGVTLKDEYKLG